MQTRSSTHRANDWTTGPVYVRRVAAGLVVASTAVLGVACSSDDPSVIEDSAALPGESPEFGDEPALPGDATVVPSAEDDADTVNEEFEGIRLYPGSEPIGRQSSEDGIVSQSFSVAGPQPNAIISHFANTLTGWDQAEVTDVGAGLRTEFSQPDGRLLEVSSTVIEEVGIEEITQYSLVLSD